MGDKNQNTEQTQEQMKAEIAALKAANSAMEKRLSAESGNGVQLKISEKGALSVYGLGRFPVTLYKTQWQKLLGVVPSITEFIKTNSAKLADKPAKKDAVTV